MIRSFRILIVGTLALCALAFSQQSLGDKKPKEHGQGQAQTDPGQPAAHKEHGQGQGKAHGKAKHHDAKNLLGEKIKHNGKHVLEQKGDVTASVDVQNGKVAGVHAKHAKKGDLPVTKYKTDKKVVRNEPVNEEPRLIPVQLEYVGTTWIGYSYIDDDGYEEIYWFPYDMVLDGDTGAIYYDPSY